MIFQSIVKPYLKWEKFWNILQIYQKNLIASKLEYISASLFRNKGFLVNLKTEKNASKFAMFMEKENP